MAIGRSIPFSKIGLLISDMAVAPTFGAWCGITGLTKTTNKDIGTTMMPDCADPDLPGWLDAYLISNQMVVSGTGTAARESFKDFEAWDRSDGGIIERDCRLVIDIAKADGGGHYEGSALLSQWELAAEAKAPWTFTFAITYNGQPTWVPLP